MGRKDDKKWRRDRGAEKMFFEMPCVNVDSEKMKARELKNSPWWRKKIADGICYYCRGRFSPADLTMDHVIPLARGGTSDRMNIVACCKDCNNKKKYLLPVEWQEYLDSIKKEGDSTDN